MFGCQKKQGWAAALVTLSAGAGGFLAGFLSQRGAEMKQFGCRGEGTCLPKILWVGGCSVGGLRQLTAASQLATVRFRCWGRSVFLIFYAPEIAVDGQYHDVAALIWLLLRFSSSSASGTSAGGLVLAADGSGAPGSTLLKKDCSCVAAER